MPPEPTDTIVICESAEKFYKFLRQYLTDSGTKAGYAFAVEPCHLTGLGWHNRKLLLYGNYPLAPAYEVLDIMFPEWQVHAEVVEEMTYGDTV